GIPRERSIIIAHQFVAANGAQVERCDSEMDPVGGLTAVDSSVFDGFLYVALGHLHKPQRVGSDSMRYAGSPVKYSFSEAGHKKSFVMGEVSPDGSVATRLVPIPSLRDARVIRGRLEDLLNPSEGADDYISVALTDEILPVSPAARLAASYSRVVSILWQPPSKTGAEDGYGAYSGDTSGLDLIGEFFSRLNGRDMSDRERDYVESLWQSVKEERP
ncbi:MAG: exonuclease SbcCD subunit D, partial [Clostridia bacterium]|nr:exonuclease SbcCD subunit D [Clostridia bacterium]